MKKVTQMVLPMFFIFITMAHAEPNSVTIPADFQNELGCPGDWQSECAVTHLSYDTEDAVWQETFSIPAGSWAYKAAINESWNENYGLNAVPNGSNIPLNLSAPTNVKFYYDHGTHWVTDDINSVIATAVGSYQKQLGCSDDWSPRCLRSWLKDPDGDGIYSFSAVLPAGDYEAKVAINESWDENYGAGGVQNGPNISFSVPLSCPGVLFSYDSVSHILEMRPINYVPENGIWKSDDGTLSFYLQKYAAGSCIIVVTMGDGFYAAFLDTNYSNGISVSDDVDQKGQTASLTPNTPTSGTITVNLVGTGAVTKAVSLMFEDAD